MGEAGRAPESAFFDFQGAVDKTMLQTFSRFGKEGERGQSGPATMFLGKLAQMYPAHFPDLLARSIVHHDTLSQNFDAVALLRQLSQTRLIWSAETLYSFNNLAKRRVFTQEELQQLASGFTLQETQEVTNERLMEDIAHIVGDEDYSFTLSLHDVAKHREAKRTTIAIQFDPLAAAIDVVFTVTSQERIRFILCRLSFPGDGESLQFDLPTTNIEDERLRKIYRDLIVKAIQHKAAKIRKREQSVVQNQAPRASANDVTLHIQTARPISRTERIALYQAQKKQVSVDEAVARVKKLPLPKKDILYQTSQTEADSAEIPEHGPKILGVDYHHITQLLQEQRIQIEPQQIIGKLRYVTRMATVSGQRPGKYINPDAYGQLSLGITLRQINWIHGTEGLRIRIYLQDFGSGIYLIRGIMVKKGERQQERYIRSLLQKIAREEKDDS